MNRTRTYSVLGCGRCSPFCSKSGPSHRPRALRSGQRVRDRRTLARCRLLVPRASRAASIARCPLCPNKRTRRRAALAAAVAARARRLRVRPVTVPAVVLKINILAIRAARSQTYRLNDRAHVRRSTSISPSPVPNRRPHVHGLDAEHVRRRISRSGEPLPSIS